MADRDIDIVQISDLHFASTTRTTDANWRHLVMQMQGADALFVTGDLIDNAMWDASRSAVVMAFQNVLEFLNELCGSAGIDPRQRLFIIPGNHDMRLSGIFRRRSSAEMFRLIFDSYSQHAFLQDLGIAVAAFDSNVSLTLTELAAGYVSKESLVAFRAFCAAQKSRRPAEWASSLKIALIHHHPVAIPETEDPKKLTERDEFLLLRNAGEFMVNIVREGFDLILHGHRHHPSFARISFPVGASEHTTAIAAAGSVHHAFPGGHPCSFNRVRISQSGAVLLERYNYSATGYELGKSFPVRDHATARRARLEALAKSSMLRATRYVRTDEIQDYSGDEVIEDVFCEARAVSAAVRELPSTFRSVAGWPDARKYEASPGQEITWEWLTKMDDEGLRSAVTRFEPPITAAKPITFRRTGRVANAFYFSKKDRRDATDREETTENISFATRQAYEHIVLSAVFPRRHFPKTAWVVVRDPERRRDEQETAFVSRELAIIPQASTISLSFERPLPGYTYEICWSLPDIDPDEPLLSERHDRIARAAGYALSDAPAGSLGPLVETFRQQIPGDADCSLFVFSDREEGLRLVSSTVLTQREGNHEIHVGQGVVGRAFRRGAVVVTVIDDERITERHSLAPFADETKVAVALPIRFPWNGGRRLGVVVLSSESNDFLADCKTQPAQVVAPMTAARSWFIHDLAPALEIDGVDELFLGPPRKHTMTARIDEVTDLDPWSKSFRARLFEPPAATSVPALTTAYKPVEDDWYSRW